jgi:hypothetical protein
MGSAWRGATYKTIEWRKNFMNPPTFDEGCLVVLDYLRHERRKLQGQALRASPRVCQMRLASFQFWQNEKIWVPTAWQMRLAFLATCHPPASHAQICARGADLASVCTREVEGHKNNFVSLSGFLM